MGWELIGALAGVIAVIIALIYNSWQIKTQTKLIEIQNKQMDNQIEIMKNDVIIKRAEFTNTFISEFRGLMPDLAYCSTLALSIYGSNEKLIKLYKSISEKDINFNVTDYKKMLKDNGTSFEEIEQMVEKYKLNYEEMLNFAEKHYLENGLGDYCRFHSVHNIYMENNRNILNSKENNEEKTIEEEISKLNDYYISSIYVSEQNTYNDFECVAQSLQFGLIDFEKITNLIYAPLNFYIKSMYIRIMQNIIKSNNEGFIVFSNISSLYLNIKQCKENLNEKLDIAEQLAEEKYKNIREDNGEKIKDIK